MPRRQRTAKARREIELSFEELGRRAKWGGALDGIPALTDDECRALQAQREASDWWVPRSTLEFLWANVDSNHGAGEWSWPGFLAALRDDQREIERVVVTHPEHRDRLRHWVNRITALGRERNAGGDVQIGTFYEALMALGYSGRIDTIH